MLRFPGEKLERGFVNSLWRTSPSLSVLLVGLLLVTAHLNYDSNGNGVYSKRVMVVYTVSVYYIYYRRAIAERSCRIRPVQQLYNVLQYNKLSCSLERFPPMTGGGMKASLRPFRASAFDSMASLLSNHQIRPHESSIMQWVTVGR